ncbi:MAG: 1-acyl-sn-glycerol-3-phosphate acyltransferase [Saprospirales bacterium]|nr:1-acyl-sn-glycerol-3-phosphate acyltransferase [Saprospirales bacterium]
MLFYLVKYPIFLALMVYFRRIHYSHRSRIPKGRRIIFAINHPSAFLDALISGAFLPFPLYFFIRGDAYINPLVRAILLSLHTLPIFRFRDGFNRLKGNQETFDRSYLILKKGTSPIMLAAEGGNSERQRLLSLQKGAAKLAFGAFTEQGLKDIVLVPIGVNYTDVQRFRSSAMVSVGEPLYLENYLDSYSNDPRLTVQQLTSDLERNMREVVVQIDRPEDEAWANPLLDIAREGEGPRWPFSSQASPLEREFQRVGRINKMSREEKAACWKDLMSYRELLEKAGLRSFHPSKIGIGNIAGYFLGIIPFSLAWLLNRPPLVLAHWIARSKVPSPVFFPSVRFVLGLFVYMGYGLLACWVIGFLGAIIIGLLGMLSLLFFDRFSGWRVIFARRNNRRS